MSLRNKSRLVKLEKELQPANGGDFMAWWKAYLGVVLDQAYDGLSADEAEQRIAALGTAPPLPNPLPLFIECAEILNQVYDPCPNLTQ